MGKSFSIYNPSEPLIYGFKLAIVVVTNLLAFVQIILSVILSIVIPREVFPASVVGIFNFIYVIISYNFELNLEFEIDDFYPLVLFLPNLLSLAINGLNFIFAVIYFVSNKEGFLDPEQLAYFTMYAMTTENIHFAVIASSSLSASIIMGNFLLIAMDLVITKLIFSTGNPSIFFTKCLVKRRKCHVKVNSCYTYGCYKNSTTEQSDNPKIINPRKLALSKCGKFQNSIVISEYASEYANFFTCSNSFPPKYSPFKGE
ncbi:uncharacterized protein ASCRUDRAFT_79406 [Ascoidea rubescens DSM 1968]|uniref:Uncharacterized protein n=1 Tax=Ascoidea rubescens DSM 1968 TaxID=1344418 RepID=A0A1D2VMA8_9ASCO|nr:hypothetical protein ASCRUDRAFT_79406 [Ascoidea rubescens DSM 1968]ODV62741.1 hypothetical protein ASCRUDRAFT_79406 [Ascoidea rubescens DSM 1968]